jgi:hypothetical protein
MSFSYVTPENLSRYAAGVKTALGTKQDNIEDLATIRANATTGAGLKDKVDGIEAQAQVNVLEGVKVNGVALTPTSKVVDVTVPTQLSDVATAEQQAAANSGIDATKRAAYDALVSADTLAEYGITDAYTKAEIDGLVSSSFHYKGSVDTYAELPASGQAVGDVWNVAQANVAANVKAGDNVAWNGTDWDVLAGVVDLSAYTPTADFVPMTDAEVDALLA